MNTLSRYALLLAAPLLLVACEKKEPEPAPVVVAPVAAPAAPVAPEPTEEQRAAAENQKKLDYANMEDKYMNDARAQWAETASASSTFGDPEPAESNQAKNATGKLDSNEWLNNNQNIGLDWIELGYTKPVQATEVRLVIGGGEGVEAISKVELQDTDGKWNLIWSGLSNIKRDERGERTWFVRTFEQTPYKVQAVRYTIANNITNGYKRVDAAQLVGD